MNKANLIDIPVEYIQPIGTNYKPVELSIAVPALNEEITIQEFITWFKLVINKLGIEAQILIIDGSSDQTPCIAVSNGVEVLRVPKLGLG